MKNVIRTNISVPKDLKTRMEGVKDRVNWSAIACTAFRAELERLDELESKQAKVKELADQLGVVVQFPPQGANDV